jgi:Zn-dependent M16 (insulinase) family peptidase
MKTTDEIFFQEGWHYDIANAEDDLAIKGVVYNEMRGAYSSPNRIISTKLKETIFPDVTYKNCAGGIPERITELTIDEFRNFHDKYYHPSNSYIYLYGKMDIDAIL